MSPPTLFDSVGGLDGVTRLAHAWHQRVLADDVVSHAFSHGFHPEHTERLAAYWCEAWGGPALYTDRYGTEASVVRMHSGNGPHEEMDHRAIQCFAGALDDAGVSDPALRRVLLDYFTWATHVRMAAYPQDADAVPSDLALARWSWEGPVESTELRSDARCRLIAATPEDVFAALRAPDRVARWWGPDGFTNTIHEFDFAPGGRWLLTMHGPDGKNYPNESRFIRIEPNRLVEIEHLSGHHFILRIELQADSAGTRVHWRQTFDTVTHYARIADFVASANEQNLERLALEVANSGHVPEAGLPRDG